MSDWQSGLMRRWESDSPMLIISLDTESIRDTSRNQ